MKVNAIPEATSSLDTWLHYLENIHDLTIDMGLDRIQTVVQKMDLLKPAPVVFTVAGTNGKGTTCRVLETILIAAGYHVGVYSSPHLLHYTERVRLQQKDVTAEQFCIAFDQIEQQRGETTLTYFEFGTLAALYLFKQAAVDVAILEVGLGGRLDATNVVEPDIAIITTIALDHISWLGSDRESIGREKAGILRSKKPAVIGETEIPNSILKIAKQKKTHLFRSQKEWFYQQVEKEWSWYSDEVIYHNLPLPEVPLMNAATALAALHKSGLKIDEKAVKVGLYNAKLVGRFQIIQQHPTIVLDVAHNPHSALYLAEKLRTISTTGKIFAVVGMLKDKDIPGTLAPLIPLIEQWYCAPLAGERGASAEMLIETLPKFEIFSTLNKAFQQANCVLEPEDILVVFGSFHTVSGVMEMIAQDKEKVR